MSQESPASTDEKSRKRHRPSWKKEQPAFLDASASVSASTFGARRIPELKQLYLQRHQCSTLAKEISVVAQDVAFQSGGGQTSSRHLRRRTTSHKSRRHRHRFPTSGPETNPEKKSFTRKAKRSSPSTLAQGHHDWNKLQISPSLETKRVQWIATHLWHAKRFHMEALWGWQIPVAHTNRGARATLRLSRTHCLIQDVTWERQPSIYLEFSRDSPTPILVQGLSRILPSWAMDSSIAKRLEQNTIVTGECILHHIDRFPRGAIGPVWWRVENHVLQVMGHPSIQPRIIENILQLRTNLPTVFREAKKETFNGIIRRRCVFRLSGTGVRKALEKSIGLQMQGQLSEAAEMLPHGATVDVTIALPGVDDVVSVLLVRVQPRPPDCPGNRVVAGWDLYCESQYACQIWTQLSMNCSAIGMVDQSHLQLECEPPLPLFPRDFVDSEESSKYWMPSSESDRCDPQTSWSRVRRLYEGGWGRLPIGKSLDLKGVQWSKLLLNTRSSVASARKMSLNSLAYSLWKNTLCRSRARPLVGALTDQVMADSERGGALRRTAWRGPSPSRPARRAAASPLNTTLSARTVSPFARRTPLTLPWCSSMRSQATP